VDTWGSLAQKRSVIRKAFAIWIHNKFREMERHRVEDKRRLDAGEISSEEYKDLVEKEHADAFTLKEIMDAHGMDYSKRVDYTQAYSALANERRDIEDYFQMFLKEGEFDRARKEGKSDDAIWGEFITAANSWNIHLLYSDADGRYKQIRLYDYAEIVNKRLRAMDSELRTKGDQIQIIGASIPTLIPQLRHPELDGIKYRHRLLVAHSWSCPFCPGVAFSDEIECKKHMEEVHHATSIEEDECILTEVDAQPRPETRDEEQQRPPKCPFCKIGDLRQLQHGDYKCRECKTIISKEEFKNFFPDA